MRSFISIFLCTGFFIGLSKAGGYQDQICIEGNTISSRFEPEDGFSREDQPVNSYQYYLQNLPLKSIDAEVKYYNGSVKKNQNVYCSVIDMDIDPVDLQQCADAVMRLRAEYLYSEKRYGEISFNFLSDGKPRFYSEYAKGDYSYSRFRKYLKYIFAYANTRSLHHELVPVLQANEIEIGDVFIQVGNPYGHAIIVVDKTINSSGVKQFILAQSYMPAQETQILVNPKSQHLSPWYSTELEIIETPEWTFKWSDLRRFPRKAP